MSYDPCASCVRVAHIRIHVYQCVLYTVVHTWESKWERKEKGEREVTMVTIKGADQTRGVRGNSLYRRLRYNVRERERERELPLTRDAENTSSSSSSSYRNTLRCNHHWHFWSLFLSSFLFRLNFISASSLLHLPLYFSSLFVVSLNSLRFV